MATLQELRDLSPQELRNRAVELKATLFDLYRPAGMTDVAPGEHSMAVRLELMDDAATLTDERIEAALTAARERALERVGARLRS